MTLHSLWFVPEGDDADHYSAIIHDLAALTGGPTFTPHVTLIGGVDAEPDRFEALAEKVVASTPPVEFTLTGLGIFREWNMSLVALAARTEEHDRVHRLAVEAFPEQAATRYLPHLSLLYVDDWDARVRALARIGEAPLRSVTMSRLELHETEGRAADLWRPLQSWSLTDTA